MSVGAYIADTISADLTFVENGTFQTDWDSVAAFRGVSEGSSTRFALAKREPLKMEHEAFRDAVLGKSMNIVTMAEGLETLRVAEAVLESAEYGLSHYALAGAFRSSEPKGGWPCASLPFVLCRTIAPSLPASPPNRGTRR